MQNTVKHNKETPSESTGLIKTPRQLIITVILAFLIPIFVIIMLIQLVAITSPKGAGSKAQTEEAIAQRLQPVAGFKLVDAAAQEAATAPADQAAQTDDATEKPAAEPKQTAAAPESEQKQTAVAEAELDPAGEKLYKSICFTCHTTGVANAPKLGDKAAWAPYIETGFDAMLEKSIQGIGAMPPRGGSQASDDEMKAALKYMLSEVEWVDAAAQEAAPADQAAQADDATEKPAAEPEQTAAAPESDQKQTAVAEAELDPAGEKLYKSICFTCHATGIANAPKLGDKAAWAPYIETGFDTMLEKSIQGVGAMPPRGGSQASDDEMKAVLEYMLSKVQ